LGGISEFVTENLPAVGARFFHVMLCYEGHVEFIRLLATLPATYVPNLANQAGDRKIGTAK
jgi:hypothetical protein